MKTKPFAFLPMLALCLGGTVALAAVQTKTGEIKSTDASKHELVLSTGDTFSTGGHVNFAKLKVGEKVTVSYETKDGKMVADKIVPAK